MRRKIQFLFGQFVPRCTHDIDKHFDGYSVLQLTDGGAINLTIEQQQFHLEGRWFFSSYPGPRIAFRAAPPHRSWVHRYLAFRGPLVKRWMSDGIFPIKPQPVPMNQEYAPRFDQMLELSRRTDRWGTARAALALESMLIELAESRARPAATPAWLEATLARMHSIGPDNDDLHQDDFAAEAGMPPRTFRRKFTAAIGTSPQDYLIGCRIGHAKQMLGATELPIKTIAEQLGYRDVSFFTRQFRNITGVPPAAYRRSREG
jgi:AraC-like DNA-binding protein